MDDDQVAPAGDVDCVLEEVELGRRAGRVVRVVEVEELRVGGALELGQEAVLLMQRQVVHLRAREDGARGVRRVAGVGSEADVARVERGERDVADAFLAAEHRDHLPVRVELDAEAVAIEVGRR